MGQTGSFVAAADSAAAQPVRTDADMTEAERAAAKETMDRLLSAAHAEIDEEEAARKAARPPPPRTEEEGGGGQGGAGTDADAGGDSKPSLLRQLEDAEDEQKERVVAPQSFHALQNDLGSVTDPQALEGMRFELMKSHNMNFASVFNVWLGTPEHVSEQRANGEFHAVLGSETMSIRAQVDTAGNVMGLCTGKLADSVTGFAQLQFANERYALIGDLTATDDESATVYGRVEHTPESLSMQCHYGQQFTPRWGAGLTGIFQPLSNAFKLGGVIRYKHPQFDVVAAMTPEAYFLAYHRKVEAQRVRLVADLSVDRGGAGGMMAMMGQGGPRACLGAEFRLFQGRVNASVDSNATLKCVVDTRVLPTINMTLNTEAKPLQSEYKVGFGLTVQS